MIGLLRGTVAEKGVGSIVLDTGGVGYEVSVPSRVMESLGELGSQASLRTFLDVREGALDLYGFSDRDELELFKALINVSRVGPKIAIKILSALTPAQIVRAVQSRDAKSLRQVPGLGEETANRLIVDLSRKIKKLRLSASALASNAPAGQGKLELRQQVVEALKNLGYSGQEVEHSLRWALETDPEPRTVEDLLKKALSYFHEPKPKA